MAIIAAREGGSIPCETHDGPTVHALSWQQVERIVERFRSLNPYDREAIPGSILQIEKRNYDASGRQRQLYAYSISAKRYALATPTADGSLQIIELSEHGLGHLLNPLDPELGDRDWFTPFWRARVTGTPGEHAEWLERPAVSRMSASSPTVLRALEAYNTGKPYADQVKPFNFLLAAAPFSHPAGYPADRFQLSAPYEPVHIGGPPDPDSVKLRGYADILARYQRHPEPKSLGPDGHVCNGDTTGLLQRRPVTAIAPTYIGKESNNPRRTPSGTRPKPDRRIHDLHRPRPRRLAANRPTRPPTVPRRRNRPTLQTPPSHRGTAPQRTLNSAPAAPRLAHPRRLRPRPRGGRATAAPRAPRSDRDTRGVPRPCHRSLSRRLGGVPGLLEDEWIGGPLVQTLYESL
jgi:hypothetical protein